MEFKEFIKTLSVPELVVLQSDLKKSPEDKKHWLMVMEEIKIRSKPGGTQ